MIPRRGRANFPLGKIARPDKLHPARHSRAALSVGIPYFAHVRTAPATFVLVVRERDVKTSG